MKIFLFVFLQFSLINANAQIDTNKTFAINRSIFLNATNDTIKPNEFIELLNSGLFDMSIIKSNDTLNIQKLDSSDLLKLFTKKSPVKNFKLSNNRILALETKQNYILHFWNSTCKPCLEELDSLILFINQNPKLKFIFITTDKIEKVDKIFKSKMYANYSMVINADKEIKKFAITSYPTFIIITKGIILKNATLGKLDSKLKEELIKHSN